MFLGFKWINNDNYNHNILKFNLEIGLYEEDENEDTESISTILINWEIEYIDENNYDPENYLEFESDKIFKPHLVCDEESWFALSELSKIFKEIDKLNSEYFSQTQVENILIENCFMDLTESFKDINEDENSD